MRRPAPVRNKRVSNPRQRKQQHLLEVTIRREIARTQRTRKMIRGSFRLIVLSGLIAAVCLGGKEAMRRFFWENPDYYLSTVRVLTDGTLTHEQVLAAAGLQEGRNIFSIDLAKAREGIDRLPQVETAEIQRVLPNRIDVRISERRPIAWVTRTADEDPSVSDKSFLIDARGVVMRSKTRSPEYPLLPIISGAEVENLVPGERVKSFEMQAALDLVRLNADSTRFQIRNIDIAKRYCLVVTDRTHAKITFGLEAIDQQLARLNRLLERTQMMQREIQTVNLLVERNVPVTFSEPAPPEPEPTAPVASPRAEEIKEKFLTTKPVVAPRSAPAVVSERLHTTAKKSETATKAKANSTPSPQKPGTKAVKKPFRS